MAENKKSEMVDLFIPRAAKNEDPNLLVGINGVNYLLPRGKTSKVPRAVYDEVKRSERAQIVADENIDNMTEAASQPK